MNVKAKRITTIAMLCALAYVVMAVGRVPVVLFFEVRSEGRGHHPRRPDLGPMTACLVSVLVSVLEMFTVSDTGILGCIMNILSTCAFACTASAIYRKKRTLAGAVAGLAAGCAVMVSAMLLWNYLITPALYGIPPGGGCGAAAPRLSPPFNLLKSGLNSGITFLLYKPVVSSLRKSGLIDAPSDRRRAGPSGCCFWPPFWWPPASSFSWPETDFSEAAHGQGKRGRPLHPLYGTAVPGAGLGRLAGLPAAGLRLHRGQAAPEPGVYAAEILLGGRRLCGLAHIAPGGGAPSIELFFHGGEAPCGEVELRLRQRLRRCQPFDNLPLLSAQLRLDCLSAQSFGDFPGSPGCPWSPQGRRAVVGMQAIPCLKRSLVSSTCSIPTRTFRSQKSRSMRPFGARRPTTASTPWRTPCFRSGGVSAPMRAGTTLSAPLSGSAISSIPAEPPLCAAAGTKALGKWEKIWYPKALSHFEGAFMKQRTFPDPRRPSPGRRPVRLPKHSRRRQRRTVHPLHRPGQTSSALLLCGGQAMLIDGGSAERGSQVAGYLSQQGSPTSTMWCVRLRMRPIWAAFPAPLHLRRGAGTLPGG